MSGILYLLALVAVPWLVAWTIRDPKSPTAIWWPFDMQEPATDGEDPSAVASAAAGRRRSAAASWRDRPRPGAQDRSRLPGGRSS
jgi:hypothetical protein